MDIGVYPLFLSLLLMGEPDTINSSAHLAETGADDTCQALLNYNDGRCAIIHSNFTCQTSLSAEIAGTEGLIQIPCPWYKNDFLTFQRKGEEPHPFQLEKMANGFEYQIREVMQCLDQKLIESPRLPHSFSLTMSRVMDAIRKQCGIRYLAE